MIQCEQLIKELSLSGDDLMAGNFSYPDLLLGSLIFYKKHGGPVSPSVPCGNDIRAKRMKKFKHFKLIV